MSFDRIVRSNNSNSRSNLQLQAVKTVKRCKMMRNKVGKFGNYAVERENKCVGACPGASDDR